MTPTVIPRAKIPQQSHTKMHGEKKKKNPASQLLSPNHPQGQISSNLLVMETRGTEEAANVAKGTIGSMNRSMASKTKWEQLL